MGIIFSFRISVSAFMLKDFPALSHFSFGTKKTKMSLFNPLGIFMSDRKSEIILTPGAYNG